VSGRRGRFPARQAAPEAARAPEDPEAYARGLVLDALARAARTRGQLAQLLARKGVEPELAEEVLERYAELGLVDDAAYAEAFTRSRHEHQGLGGRAIAFQLRRRSVPDELVREALASLDSDQELDTARRLARERQARMAGLPREVQVRRLAGFLARKGYGGEVAGRAVREALAAAEEPAGRQGPDADGFPDGFDPEELGFSADD
jgi:regulatory protein